MAQMDTVTIEQTFAIRKALAAAFSQHGMRLLPGGVEQVEQLLKSKGVAVTINPAGFLELRQDATQIVVSSALEGIRTQAPALFVSDPRYDAISSREDFRGSPAEILKAKALWLSQHSLAAWETMPATKAEAERKAAPIDANMSRAQYMALSLAEKSQLISAIGSEGIEQIMVRTK